MRWQQLLVVLSACASAGKPDIGHDNPDAAVRVVDAPRAIDAPMMSVCTSNATCQGAIDLGSISGDTGGAMVTASGYQAAWYRVRVTENDNGIVGVKLSVTTTLTSPASTNYDVFVYVNTGSDVIECTTPSGKVMTSGTTDSIRLSWGEGTVANGSDDSRTVSIEIRPIAGMCSAAQPWRLVVLGHT